METMSGHKAAGSVFMCQLCNLFSPSRSQLVTHCSQLHPEQEFPDDIITALLPLVAESVEQLGEPAVKRKRGRPKGSTKKICRDLTDGKAKSTQSQVDSSEKGKRQGGISGLECKRCHRTFSNRRQILKHICIREEDEEEDDGSTCGGAEVEGSENLDPCGVDLSEKKQNTRPAFKRKKDLGNFGAPRTNRNNVSKEGSLLKGNKKKVINVFLTEDLTLPGVSKMVPVEDSLAETESAAQTQAIAKTADSTVLQNYSQAIPSGASASGATHKTDQTTSSNSASTKTSNSKGFQEYSIKQEATSLLQSQLKIFACEFCNKIFKFRHSLVAHLRTHTQEKPFKCPHCDYASANKANLNVHLRKHTGEKFSCQQCPFTCLSPGHLKVHIERVHLKVKQRCSFCDKKYSDVKNLLKHMEIRHNLKDPAVHQSYQQLRLKTRQGLRQLLYHCPTCNRRFKNQLVRERHLLVHGPQRPFACLLCDHAATNMAGLTAHLRKHLFLYVCCECKEKFVSSQRLKSHLKESHPELEQEQAFSNCINSSYHLIQDEGDTGERQKSEDTQRGKQQSDGTGQVAQQGLMKEGDGKSGAELRAGKGQAKAKEESEEVQLIERETGKGVLSHEEEANQGSKVKQDETAAGRSCDKTTDLSTSAPECMSRHEEDSHTFLTPTKRPSQGSEDETLKDFHTTAGTTSAAKSTQTPSSAGNTNSNLSSDPVMDNSQNSLSEKESGVVHQSAFHQVFSSLQKTQLNMETFQRLRKIYGDLECQYCGKLFWYKVHHNVHVRTHTKEHSHYCSKCNYSCITKSSLKRHQIQKHSGFLLPCSNPGCKYVTPDKYKLQVHQRTHHGEARTASCSVCQQSYPEHRLKHHMKTSHPDSAPAQGKGLMVQRAEKCPYCDSYFLKKSSDFQQHIWAHQGLKPYLCSECDYAGRSRSNLKTHMNRHNTDRRHLCDLCGKKFKSKVTLKSHRLSHTDEGKRFQCSACDYTSVSRPYLLRHTEQHAEFKPFRCAHCNYSCNIAGALKRHYSVKHPEEKYKNAGPGLTDSEALKQQGGLKCPECDFVYGTKWELNRHLKNKHRLKVVGDWEVGEEVEAQYVSVEDEEQLTEAQLAALQDTANIQQITEFNSETQNAVTSMVAMAPGTVTVVQQLQVSEEQEVDNFSNQLMVLDTDAALDGNQVMVVEEAHGLEALTVLTQGDDAHHYIVYVQEHTVEIN